MIDFHGNAMTQHVANRAWDAAKWVAGLRKASRLSSREIYWKVWGLTHFLTCGECGEQFPVCELDHSSAIEAQMAQQRKKGQVSHW